MLRWYGVPATELNLSYATTIQQSNVINILLMQCQLCLYKLTYFKGHKLPTIAACKCKVLA